MNSSFKPSSGLQQLDINKVLEDYILRSDHDQIVSEMKADKLDLKADKSKLEEKLEAKEAQFKQDLKKAKAEAKLEI